MCRSSRPDVFCKEGVLKIFTKFTGKHLCQSLFFNKFTGLRPETCNFIKKIIWHRDFPVNFAKFLRTPFLTEHLQWLLLHVLDNIIFFFHNFDKQGKTSSNYNARVSSNFFERLIMRTKHTKK